MPGTPMCRSTTQSALGCTRSYAFLRSRKRAYILKTELSQKIRALGPFLEACLRTGLQVEPYGKGIPFPPNYR